MGYRSVMVQVGIIFLASLSHSLWDTSPIFSGPVSCRLGHSLCMYFLSFSFHFQKRVLKSKERKVIRFFFKQKVKLEHKEFFFLTVKKG